MQNTIFQKPWLLSVASAVALSLAWYFPLGCLSLFFAFVPLMLIEEQIRKKTKKHFILTFWGYAYLTLFLWNLLTTWWVWNASAGGAIAMLFANTFLMTLPWLAFSLAKNHFNNAYAIWVLPTAWIAFEYLHLNWELSWPWLNLGNGFAYTHPLVQWYEYTGVLGGTLWVLVMNIFFYEFISKKQKKSLLTALVVLGVPIVFSLILYVAHQEKGEKVEIVVVQPNIDPYTEKFAGTERFIPYYQQAQLFLELASQKITPQTQLLLFPETAFDEGYDEKQIHQYAPIRLIKDFLKKNPQIYLLGGTTSWEIYGSDKKTYTARKNEQIGYYDVFNTAMFLGAKVDSIAFYHKSKLVPIVESMPYPNVIEKILGNVIIDLGGTSGGLGWQKEREVFFSEKFGFAPIICYESVYGAYVSEYVQKGANILCVITNDGWWGDTPGYRQHWQMAKLRAIETRRSVARSANTGISGFINQRGDSIEKTAYWVKDARRQSLQANTEITLYARWGDWIGKLTLLALPLLLVWGVIFRRKK